MPKDIFENVREILRRDARMTELFVKDACEVSQREEDLHCQFGLSKAWEERERERRSRLPGRDTLGQNGKTCCCSSFLPKIHKIYFAMSDFQ